MKKLVSVLIVAVAVVLGLAILKNGIAQGAVQGVFKTMTGLDLKIGSMNLGLMAGRLEARGIQLQNPAGFVDPVMVDMPVLLVDLVPGSLMKGGAHLEEVQLELKELMVVKDAQGRLNLDALKPAGGEKASAGKPAKAAKAPQIQIDSLRLKIGKVIYKDYSKGAEPSVQEFALNLDESYRNISNINAILPLIVTKALYNTTLGKLINFDLKGLASQLDLSGMDLNSLGLSKFKDLSTAAAKQAQDALSGAQSALKKAAAGSGDAAKDLTKTADEAVKSVTDLLGSVTKKSN